LLIIKPDPFKIAFKPRSKERREEALRIWEEAEGEDRRKRVAFLAAAREARHSLLEKVPICTGVPVQMTPVKDEVVLQVDSVFRQ